MRSGDLSWDGLGLASVLKCDKLATVERRILIGEIGHLWSTLIRELNVCLRDSLGL